LLSERLLRVYVVAEMYRKWLTRRPLTYFFVAMYMPVSILVPLVILAPEAYHVDVVVGALLFSVVGGGIADVALNVSYDRATRRIAFLATRPLEPFEYMLGVMLGGASYTMVGALVVLLVGQLALGFKLGVAQALGLLALAFYAYTISACLGFTLALYGPKDFRLAGSLADVLLFTLTFIAPVYYPADLLPDPLKTLSYTLYTTHIALIGKALARGEAILIDSLTITTLFLIAMLLIAKRGLKWVES